MFFLRTKKVAAVTFNVSLLLSSSHVDMKILGVKSLNKDTVNNGVQPALTGKAS